METLDTAKVDDSDSTDATNRGVVASGFGIGLLVIGGSITLVWIGFILWLLGVWAGLWSLITFLSSVGH